MISCVKATLLSVPFAGLASMLACAVGTRGGLLSEGLDCLYAVLGSCLASLCVVAAACAVRLRPGGGLRWTALIALAFGTAVLATIGIGHRLLTSQVRVLLHPVPATRDMRVVRSRSVMFAGYLHVRCTKAFCAEVIRLKDLREISEDTQPEPDMTPMSARRSTQAMWDWWQPGSMPGARFYFKHHSSDAPQGWSEGVWTNGDMTEMYVFIRG